MRCNRNLFPNCTGVPQYATAARRPSRRQAKIPRQPRHLKRLRPLKDKREILDSLLTSQRRPSSSADVKCRPPTGVRPMTWRRLPCSGRALGRFIPHLSLGDGNMAGSSDFRARWGAGAPFCSLGASLPKSPQVTLHGRTGPRAVALYARRPPSRHLPTSCPIRWASGRLRLRVGTKKRFASGSQAQSGLRSLGESAVELVVNRTRRLCRIRTSPSGIPRDAVQQLCDSQNRNSVQPAFTLMRHGCKKERSDCMCDAVFCRLPSGGPGLQRLTTPLTRTTKLSTAVRAAFRLTN